MIMSNPYKLDDTTQNKIAYAIGCENGRAEEREHIINIIEEIKQCTFYCMGDMCDDTTLEGYHCSTCALDYIIERLKEVKDYA